MIFLCFISDPDPSFILTEKTDPIRILNTDVNKDPAKYILVQRNCQTCTGSNQNINDEISTYGNTFRKKGEKTNVKDQTNISNVNTFSDIIYKVYV